MKNCLILIFCLTAHSIFSQSPEKGKWQFSYVQASASISSDHYTGVDFEDFKSNAKNKNEFREIDLSQFSKGKYSDPSAFFNFSAVLSPSKNSILKPIYSIGIAYLRHGRKYYDYWREEEVGSDIAVFEYYSYEETIDEIALEGACLFEGRKGKRFKTLVGIGLGAGYSVHLSTAEYYYADTTITTFNNQGFQTVQSTGNSTFSNQYIKSKPAIYYRVFLPIGLSFDIVKRITVTAEIKPGLAYEKRINGNGYWRNQNSFGLGVRYNFVAKSA
ncbi:MAG: hypothetical protein COA57_09915 [Flavobacteriales bacterium]|nr:MAG: hypothetical protein COA57_09915 [Flavobacteriales bacterium]